MKELLAAKLKYLVVADRFTADVPAAKKLFAEWPTPIYVMGDAGKEIVFPGASIDKEFTSAAPDSPFIPAYQAYKPMPYDTPAPAMAASLYAARPQEGYFKVQAPGTITIADDGRANFTPSDKGVHRYLTVDPEKKDKVVQTLVELASAKPVLPQRFRPPDAVDKKANDKKPDAPEKKP